MFTLCLLMRIKILKHSLIISLAYLKLSFVFVCLRLCVRHYLSTFYLSALKNYIFRLFSYSRHPHTCIASKPITKLFQMVYNQWHFCCKHQSCRIQDVSFSPFTMSRFRLFHLQPMPFYHYKKVQYCKLELKSSFMQQYYFEKREIVVIMEKKYLQHALQFLHLSKDWFSIYT